MKRITLSIFTLMASASAVLAGNVDCFTTPGDPVCATAVPEISALEGTAALAAIAAVLLLAWERRARAH